MGLSGLILNIGACSSFTEKKLLNFYMLVVAHTGMVSDWEFGKQVLL